MHHPERLDATALDGLEHLDGLEPLPRRDARRAPEAADALHVGRRVAHVRGQHVGEPAHFAPAHGVRLTRQRQRPAARPADPGAGQMAIEDGIDLVRPLRRLVHALAVAGDDLVADDEPAHEGRNVVRREAGLLGHGLDIRSDPPRREQGLVEAGRVVSTKS